VLFGAVLFGAVTFIQPGNSSLRLHVHFIACRSRSTPRRGPRSCRFPSPGAEPAQIPLSLGGAAIELEVITEYDPSRFGGGIAPARGDSTSNGILFATGPARCARPPDEHAARRVTDDGAMSRARSILHRKSYPTGPQNCQGSHN
jgi:hypothetical protein